MEEVYIKDEHSDITATEMVTVKQEKEDDYDPMVITGQENEEYDFNEDYKIEVDCLENELDPLSSNKDNSKSESDLKLKELHVENDWDLAKNSLRNVRKDTSSMKSNVVEEHTVEDTLIKSEPEEDAPQNDLLAIMKSIFNKEERNEDNGDDIPRQDSNNKEESDEDNGGDLPRQDANNEKSNDNGNNSPLQDAIIDKFLKMWKVLYPEVDAQEQRNIYREKKGCVRQTIEKVKLLNKERIQMKKLPFNTKEKIDNANRKRKRNDSTELIDVENQVKEKEVAQSKAPKQEIFSEHSEGSVKQRVWSSCGGRSSGSQRGISYIVNVRDDLTTDGNLDTSTESSNISNAYQTSSLSSDSNAESNAESSPETTDANEEVVVPEDLDMIRTPCSLPDDNEDIAIPEGWRRTFVMRKAGYSAGKFDIYYFSPEGKKLRSVNEVKTYCKKHGIDIDMSLIDFQSGKRQTATKVPYTLSSAKTPTPKTSMTLKKRGRPRNSTESKKEEAIPRVPLININVLEVLPEKSVLELSESNPSKKPKYSGIELVDMVIRESPDQQLHLSEIFQCVETKFPYYAQQNAKKKQRWRRYISQILSMYDCFKKVPPKDSDWSGKGNYWALGPGHEDNFYSCKHRHFNHQGQFTREFLPQIPTEEDFIKSVPGPLPTNSEYSNSKDVTEEGVKDTGDSDPSKKPGYTTIALIDMVIRDSPEQQLQSRDIVLSIEKRFPYFEQQNTKEKERFKKSIKNILGNYHCFQNVPPKDTDWSGKGNYWALGPEHKDSFHNCINRHHYYNKPGRRDFKSKVLIEEEYITCEPDPISTNSEYSNIEDDDTIPIEEDFVKSEQDPLTTNTGYLNSEDEKVYSVFESSSPSSAVSSSFCKIWPTEKTLKLITLLHSKPSLWDIDSKVSSKNRRKKANDLSEIAEKISESETSTIKNINALKGKFRREHVKLICMIQSETLPKKSLWFGYEPLMFLLQGQETTGDWTTDSTINKEMLDEANQNSEECVIDNIEDDYDDSQVTDSKIAQYIKMWTTLYPEIEAQELREIYQECKGVVFEAMNKMRQVNRDRKLLHNRRRTRTKFYFPKSEKLMYIDGYLWEVTADENVVDTQNVEEDIQNKEKSESKNENKTLNTEFQDDKIDKYVKMWNVLYHEVHAEESRKIYQETNGNVQQSMEKIRLLNEERKIKGKPNQSKLGIWTNGSKPFGPLL